MDTNITLYTSIYVPPDEALGYMELFVEGYMSILNF